MRGVTPRRDEAPSAEPRAPAPRAVGAERAPAGPRGAPREGAAAPGGRGGARRDAGARRGPERRVQDARKLRRGGRDLYGNLVVAGTGRAGRLRLVVRERPDLPHAPEGA